MTDTDSTKSTIDTDVLVPTNTPLVFISHDSRDAELAEAFGKLLKSVSAGMIKTFRSSDKKGKEGIDFGDEWYKRLMSKLQSTSDVVCLFTERSIDRPWILFEAGVAKGKLGTPVIGVALGVPISRVSSGPFYQFQNMDDSELDLTKLVNQLSRRVPGLELDNDVVKVQIDTFKEIEVEILKKIVTSDGKKAVKDQTEENPVSKLVEEMKALPTRVAERLAESDESIHLRQRPRHISRGMIDDIVRMGGMLGDPIGILLLASYIRNDAPWLYELSVEMYNAVKIGDRSAIDIGLSRIERISEMFIKNDIGFEGFVNRDKDTYYIFREFPSMIKYLVQKTLESKNYRPKRSIKPISRTKSNKPLDLLS